MFVYRSDSMYEKKNHQREFGGDSYMNMISARFKRKLLTFFSGGPGHDDTTGGSGAT